MKIFITSDHHFGHRNIIRYCARPFGSVEEMNEELINRWNEVVGPTDIVIHLGDFSFGDERRVHEVKSRLNGTVILIVGNHDYYASKSKEFLVVDGNLIIDNFILSHRPLPLEEIPNGFVNIHGHIHEKESYIGINVSVERTNYFPIELNQIKIRR